MTKARVYCLFALLTLPIFGNAATTYLWSNDKGMEAADLSKCAYVNDPSPLQIADPGAEADDWFYDNSCGTKRKPFFCQTMKLKGRSIVKLVDGKKYDDYQLANLTGLNKQPDEVLKANEWAFRNFEGYVKKSSLQPIENYLIRITEGVDLNEQEDSELELGVIPGTGIRYVDAFLRRSADTTGYKTLKCDGKLYTLFDLIFEEGDAAIARIAVYDDDTKILRNVQVIPATESAIPENNVMEDPNEKPMSDIPYPMPRPGFKIEEDRKKAAEEAAKKRTTILSAYNEIACAATKDGEIEIRNQTHDKVEFKVKNGTELKSFQDFNPLDWTSWFPPMKDQYVRVQVVADGRTGWIKNSERAQAGKCATAEAAPAPGNTGPDAPEDQADIPVPPSEPMKAGSYTTCTKDGGWARTYDLEFNLKDQGAYSFTGDKVTITDGQLFNLPKPNGHFYVKVQPDLGGDAVYIASDLLTDQKCATALSETVAAIDTTGYIFPVTQPTGYSYIASNRRPFQHSKYVYKNGKPLAGYELGWGLYGASRRGRAHAATDLYQPKGLPIPEGLKDLRKRKDKDDFDHYGGPAVAMMGGRVLRKAMDFYGGTGELPVLLDDGTIRRYGEIYEAKARDVGRFEQGDTLAHICWTGVYEVPPMLHLECYDPAKNKDVDLIAKAENVRNGLNDNPGAKIGGRKTRRSVGLMNCTNFMLKLEQVTFGNKEKQSE